MAAIGDHIRRRRLDLGLLQQDVAALAGVDTTTVTNWELGRTSPALRSLPKIWEFLGYRPPEPAGGDLSARLRAARRRAGLSQAGLAARLEVNESSVASWERGEHRPTGPCWELVEGFLLGDP